LEAVFEVFGLAVDGGEEGGEVGGCVEDGDGGFRGGG
jgi:hypothetical protein